MEYIHYGHNKFDKNRFDAIKNRPYSVKPLGGLWASRTDTEDGWKDFVKGNNLSIGDFRTSFKFTLKDTARVLTIDNHEMLDNLPQVKNDLPMEAYKVLDFEKLLEDYDAVEVLISEDGWLYHKLYGWDCDSILIMNPDIIVSEIPKNKSNNNDKYISYDERLSDDEIDEWCKNIFDYVSTSNQKICYVSRDDYLNDSNFYFVNSQEKVVIKLNNPILKKFASHFYALQLYKKQEQWLLDYNRSGYTYFSSLENYEKWNEKVYKIYDSYNSRKVIKEKIREAAKEIEELSTMDEIDMEK